VPCDLIHLAHIDHGWRQESSIQSESLAMLAKTLKLPFHLKTLSKEDFMSGNMEDVARKHRLDFFKTIYASIGAEALLLGHQQEDLAETTLKRVFEGAGILSCAAVKKQGIYEGMTILRPLLTYKKEELLSWLARNGIDDFITDPTNLHPRFLRARMRTNIFPSLETSFGKNIVSSIANFSEDLDAVSSFLEKKFARSYAMLRCRLLASYLDFSTLDELDPSLYSLFLRYLFRRMDLPCSRDVADQIAADIQNHSVNKRYCLGKQLLFVENTTIFMQTKIIPWPRSIQLDEGIYSLEGFTLEVKWTDPLDPSIASNWEDAIDGRFYLNLPAGGFNLINFDFFNKYGFSKKIKNKLSQYKVPCFLRSLFPFVFDNNLLIYEFLTGQIDDHCKEKSVKQLYLRVFLNDK
jgi:tRNA(Ile)-lysidine synthase